MLPWESSKHPTVPMSSIRDQVLQVTVVRCEKLRDPGWLMGKQNPYVSLEYGRHKGRTKICEDGGTNPNFNAKFEFSVIEGIQEIKLDVWSSGVRTYSTDVKIGSGTIQLERLLTNGDDEKCWPLWYEKRAAGEIFLILHLRERQKTDQAPFRPQGIAQSPYNYYPLAPGYRHTPSYSSAYDQTSQFFANSRPPRKNYRHTPSFPSAYDQTPQFVANGPALQYYSPPSSSSGLSATAKKTNVMVVNVSSNSESECTSPSTDEDRSNTAFLQADMQNKSQDVEEFPEDAPPSMNNAADIDSSEVITVKDAPTVIEAESVLMEQTPNKNTPMTFDGIIVAEKSDSSRQVFSADPKTLIAMNEDLFGNLNKLLEEVETSPEQETVPTSPKFANVHEQFSTLLSLGFPDIFELNQVTTLVNLAGKLYTDPSLSEDQNRILSMCLDLPKHFEVYKNHADFKDNARKALDEVETMKQNGKILKEKHEVYKAQDSTDNEDLTKLDEELAGLEDAMSHLQQKITDKRTIKDALKAKQEIRAMDINLIQQDLQTLLGSLEKAVKCVSGYKKDQRSAEEAQEQLLAKLNSLAQTKF